MSKLGPQQAYDEEADGADRISESCQLECTEIVLAIKLLFFIGCW